MIYTDDISEAPWVANAPFRAPFPYFGGKRDVARDIWRCLGQPKQYIEPFCGSAAMLLSAPKPASLEVAGDFNGFIVNFWRAVKSQPEEVARWADYPVSHIDLGARHIWLMRQRDRVGAELHDADWPGDAKVAGWWLWGQCCWIASGWCEWIGKTPQVGNAGVGVQAAGSIPHLSDAGMGVQAVGHVPQVIGAGVGDLWTSSGVAAWQILRRLSGRLERVRLIHGDWSRCMNHHYGSNDTAVFFDPPYDGYEGLYRADSVVRGVLDWCLEHTHLRVAICGHAGDYDLPGWTMLTWSRRRFTYGSDATKDLEAVWFSPACEIPRRTRHSGKL